MKLDALKLKNFKAFRDLEMRNIPRFCVLIGANGAGKSTIFRVFEFLQDALKDDVQTALTKLGGSRGFEEVRSRNTTGPIEIEVKFRAETDGPLITYFLSIDCEKGQPFVVHELLKYRRGSHGRPWHFLEFRRGEGTAVKNEPDLVTDESMLQRESYTLKSPDILAIKGLAQFEKFPATKALGTLIERWHISDFRIQQARPEPQIAFANHLSREGDNLALVVEHLYKRHPAVFQKVLSAMARRVPGINKVEAKITEEGRVLLRFTDRAFQEAFLARHVSDGTLKMLAYLVLLYDPEPHPLLCVEEPENQLFPTLLEELADEFRLYAARGGQVFVSTHSPDFLNALHLEDVYWLTKKDGYTSACRASDDPQLKQYVSDGETLGYLWKEGHFRNLNPE